MIIESGGATGLTAAGYLGRFRRPCLVSDVADLALGGLRKVIIIPGSPQAVADHALLEKLKAPAVKCGATLMRATVQRLRKTATGFESEPPFTIDCDHLWKIETDPTRLETRWIYFGGAIVTLLITDVAIA